MSTPVLRLEGVSKTYPGVRALDQVSIDCLPGEVHAILGENGSGKSTLMKIASGVVRPDSGSVEIAGQRLANVDPRTASGLGLSTVYQDDSLVLELTVAQNLFMKERAGETPRGYVHVISDAPDKGCVGEIRPSGGTNLEQKVEFKSGGYTLKGVLTRPEGKSNVPLVVMAGGWCYTKEIVLPNYAKEFVDIGCATLAFDYRNFGESEGDIRQNLNPWRCD